MSTVTDLTETAQEQTLAAIRQSQQFVVDAVRTWAEAVERPRHRAGERRPARAADQEQSPAPPSG